MQPHALTMTEPLQHSILELANALMTVEARKRPALARELIAQSHALAARYKNAWGANLPSVAMQHRHIVEGPNPQRHFYASLATRDGLAALEDAVAALLDEVRATEAMSEGVAA